MAFKQRVYSAWRASYLQAFKKKKKLNSFLGERLALIKKKRPQTDARTTTTKNMCKYYIII